MPKRVLESDFFDFPIREFTDIIMPNGKRLGSCNARDLRTMADEDDRYLKAMEAARNLPPHMRLEEATRQNLLTPVQAVLLMILEAK